MKMRRDTMPERCGEDKINMPNSSKAEWIVLLKKQLHEAEEREQRWLRLGEQLRKKEEDFWMRVAELRKSEVELFKLLIKRNEDE